MIDRRFRHVGRIKRASGTDSLDELKSINEALTAISEIPRYDILRAVQDGTYTAREVWQAHRKGRLDSLISSKQTRGLLFPAMQEWIDGYQCSDSHRTSLNQSRRYLLRVGSKHSSIEDLPRLLEKLRKEMNADDQGRSFNVTRAAAQAFIRSTFRKMHPIWIEITGIERLDEGKGRESKPLTPDELRELMGRLIPEHAAHAWAMAVGGMGPKEYWGRWEIQADRVRIHGTKRKGRDRFVPLLDVSIQPPTRQYRAFQKTLQRKGKGVQPYDMRRSFANWMEDAGIPRTRRRMYMGHGAKDVTDLYERRDIERFLKEDAESLKKYVFGDRPTEGLKLVKA